MIRALVLSDMVDSSWLKSDDSNAVTEVKCEVGFAKRSTDHEEEGQRTTDYEETRRETGVLEEANDHGGQGRHEATDGQGSIPFLAS
jgi:hypothetical protein